MFFQVNNIPAIAGVSFSFDVSLHCTMHPSGLRSLVKRYPLTPSALLADQKTIGSMLCPRRIAQILWLLASIEWLTTWAAKMLITI